MKKYVQVRQVTSRVKRCLRTQKATNVFGDEFGLWYKLTGRKGRGKRREGEDCMNGRVTSFPDEKEKEKSKDGGGRGKGPDP